MYENKLKTTRRSQVALECGNIVGEIIFQTAFSRDIVVFPLVCELPPGFVEKCHGEFPQRGSTTSTGCSCPRNNVVDLHQYMAAGRSCTEKRFLFAVS
eukprot:2980631-Amphidinium_carterae.1